MLQSHSPFASSPAALKRDPGIQHATDFPVYRKMHGLQVTGFPCLFNSVLWTLRRMFVGEGQIGLPVSCAERLFLVYVVSYYTWPCCRSQRGSYAKKCRRWEVDIIPYDVLSYYYIQR